MSLVKLIKKKKGRVGGLRGGGTRTCCVMSEMKNPQRGSTNMKPKKNTPEIERQTEPDSQPHVKKHRLEKTNQF